VNIANTVNMDMKIHFLTGTDFFSRANFLSIRIEAPAPKMNEKYKTIMKFI